MGDFTHFNEQGKAKMVDVGDKPVSHDCGGSRQCQGEPGDVPAYPEWRDEKRGRTDSGSDCGNHGGEKDMGIDSHVSSHFFAGD